MPVNINCHYFDSYGFCEHPEFKRKFLWMNLTHCVETQVSDRCSYPLRIWDGKVPTEVTPHPMAKKQIVDKSKGRYNFINRRIK